MNDDVRVAVLIEKDGRFLLGQEAAKIIHGLWNWQQGKVETGEDLKTAAIREVKEETGFDVSLLRKLTVLKNPFPGTKATHVYLGEIIGGSQSFHKSEILDLQWFTYNQIIEIKDKLTGSWLIEVIQKGVEKKRKKKIVRRTP